MTDHQYYNGVGYVTKANTMNKSASAALSRENIYQAPYRRVEPKHLQPPPSSRAGPGHRHEQPDLIRDYREVPTMHGKDPALYRQQPGLDSTIHPVYQQDAAFDSVRKSQGTNTKPPHREFQIYANTDTKKGEFIYDSPTKQERSYNGAVPNHSESRDSVRNSQAPRPRSRGVSMNGSTLEVINMKYNSIQQQMEGNLLPKSRPVTKVKSEETTTKVGKDTEKPPIPTGRKTPADSISRSTPEEQPRPANRMTQAEIIRHRNLSSAGRKTPIEPPHLRKHVMEDSSQRSPNYQQFTQDKVSPIITSSHRSSGSSDSSRQSSGPNDPARQTGQKSLETNSTPPRSRVPPHERTRRTTKENFDQLRKPRPESRPSNPQSNGDIISHLPGVRQQPMGAEAIARPATSMGFDRNTSRGPNSSSDGRQMTVLEKLHHLQRRKSGAPVSDGNKGDFATRPPTDIQSSPSEGRGRRSGQERRKSYTTSTPAKGRMQVERPPSRGSVLSRSTDERASRALADSTNFSESHRTAARLKDVLGNSLNSTDMSFRERSLIRWQEIDKLMSNSAGDNFQEEVNKNGVDLRTEYPFFSEFSKDKRRISNSLDSLNQEVSQHLAEHQYPGDRPLVNGDSARRHGLLAAVADNDSDFQGTPQLSSPVDFCPENENYQSSSNEDLDLEVRDLLAEPTNRVDPIEVALYQKMIDAKIHEKMTILRDRRFSLEKKDGSLKYKRDKLQRRMQEMLAKTTAVLNKSIELDKSRSLKEMELREQTRPTGDPQELSIIHALSSTIRPDSKPPVSHGHSSRPQYVSESFNNHSAIMCSPFSSYSNSLACSGSSGDSFTSSVSESPSSCSVSTNDTSSPKQPLCAESDELSGSIDVNTSICFHTINASDDPTSSKVHIMATGHTINSTTPGKDQSNDFDVSSETNEGSLSFSFYSVHDMGECLIPNDQNSVSRDFRYCVQSSVDSGIIRNRYTKLPWGTVGLKLSKDNNRVSEKLAVIHDSVPCIRTFSVLDSDAAFSEQSQCVSINFPTVNETTESGCPQSENQGQCLNEFSETSADKVIRVPKRCSTVSLRRKAIENCLSDAVYFSTSRPPREDQNITVAPATIDTNNRDMLLIRHPISTKRKNMFSSTPIPNKRSRLSRDLMDKSIISHGRAIDNNELNLSAITQLSSELSGDLQLSSESLRSASHAGPRFNRFSVTRRVTFGTGRRKHWRPKSRAEIIHHVQDKIAKYVSPESENVNRHSRNETGSKFTIRRFCSTRRFTIRQVRGSRVLKLRGTQLPVRRTVKA